MPRSPGSSEPTKFCVIRGHFEPSPGTAGGQKALRTVELPVRSGRGARPGPANIAAQSRPSGHERKLSPDGVKDRFWTVDRRAPTATGAIAAHTRTEKNLYPPIATPIAFPIANVTAAAAMPRASWRPPDVHTDRPVKSVMAAPIPKSPSAPAAMLAIVAARLIRKKYGASGTIAKIAFDGIYNAKNFATASDGHGGTKIVYHSTGLL